MNGMWKELFLTKWLQHVHLIDAKGWSVERWREELHKTFRADFGTAFDAD